MGKEFNMRRNFGKELLYSSFILGSLVLISGQKSVSANSNVSQQDETISTVIPSDSQTATETQSENIKVNNPNSSETNELVASEAVTSASAVVQDNTAVASTVAQPAAKVESETEAQDTPNETSTAATSSATPELVRTENYQDLYLQGITTADLGLSNQGLPGWIISTISNGAISPVMSVKDSSNNYQQYDEQAVNDQSILGVIDNYSIFTFNSLKLSNITVNGRVAVGGDVTLSNAAINGETDNYNLIVGGSTLLKSNSSVNGLGILIDQSTNAWDTLWAGEK